MTSAVEQFPYLQMDPAAGAASVSPFVGLELVLGKSRASAVGLVDSGAAVNVLPHDVGLRLVQYGSIKRPGLS